MALRDVLNDAPYQALARETLAEAAKAVGVEIVRTSLGDRDRDARYAWCCFIVDPAAEDRRSAMTLRSAVDHLKVFDPNGFLSQTEQQLVAVIHEIEFSSEAPFTLLNDEGEEFVYSPWMANLASVRAVFTYRNQAF